MRRIQKKVSQVLDYLSWWIYSDCQSNYLSRQEFFCILRQNEELINELKDVTHKLAARYEEADEMISRAIMNLLDSIEGVARGDLTIRVRAEDELYSLRVIAESFNVVVENFASVIKSLPEENSTRSKYKI